MNVQDSALPGVLIIEPKIFGDNRGFFGGAAPDARRDLSMSRARASRAGFATG